MPWVGRPQGSASARSVITMVTTMAAAKSSCMGRRSHRGRCGRQRGVSRGAVRMRVPRGAVAGRRHDRVVGGRLRQHAPQHAVSAAAFGHQRQRDGRARHRRPQRPREPQHPGHEQGERVRAEHEPRGGVGHEPLDPAVAAPSFRSCARSRGRGQAAAHLVQHLPLPFGARVPVGHARERLEIARDLIRRLVHARFRLVSVARRQLPRGPCRPAPTRAVRSYPFPRAPSFPAPSALPPRPRAGGDRRRGVPNR